MATAASSDASSQAARLPWLWPITATVAVIKSLAAIRGEAEPLTPELVMGETAADAPSAPRRYPASESPADDAVPQDSGGGLPAPSTEYASGEDGAAVAIEPMGEGESRVDETLLASAARTGTGGVPFADGVRSSVSPSADAPSAASPSAGTGGGPTQPAEALADDQPLPTQALAADPPPATGGADTAEGPADEGPAGAQSSGSADGDAGPSPFLARAGADDGFGYTLIGDGYDDYLVGTLGDDRMDGGGGDDGLRGLIGDDTLEGGSGDDTINGGGGDDRLLGGPDDDTITGGSGDDWMHGGAGADTLFGLAGDDTLMGGLGRDELSGMAGADRFVFTHVADSPAHTPDWVLDFRAYEQDTIDLSAIDANAWTWEDDAFTVIGNEAFSATPGELRIAEQPHYSVLEGDVDGDGAPDIGITLLGVSDFTIDDVIT